MFTSRSTWMRAVVAYSAGMVSSTLKARRIITPPVRWMKKSGIRSHHTFSTFTRLFYASPARRNPTWTRQSW